jgi:phosphate transport system substrate-binding protein
MTSRNLGNSGPVVSAFGLGCMAMSGTYGPADRAESIATIHAALDAGITLLDTGDFYGMGHNELLIREALAGRRRDKLLLSVKFGALRDPGQNWSMPGVSADLNFTPDALAGIFLGKVTKWNDPAIAGANKGVNLPGNDIVVVHRSEGSGTTYIWTDYLSKISADWKNKVGKGTSVNWPVGLGGKGNEGVAGLIKQTPNSFGYVELIYAVQNNMPFGKVRNSSGTFVKADLASVTAAAAAASKTMPDDFRVSITDPAGKTAYPISSFTWLLIPSKFSDGSKRDALKGFVKWMLSDGQTYAEPLSYAKLPKEVVAKETAALSKIQ